MRADKREWWIERLLPEDAPACEAVLRALPAWFGLEEAIASYRASAASEPTFGARDRERGLLGFLTLRLPYPQSAELVCMGVRPELRRRGLGSALLRSAERWLLTEGVSFLQVKTLSPRSPDRGYAETRAFYLARGFSPLAEFPELWGPKNPCLQLVKHFCPKA